MTFSYIEHAVMLASKEGFVPYTEFPEIGRVYSENVVDIFGARLTKSERADIEDFYNFWEIPENRKDDKLCLLAHTQGLLPTDNFEFLADYLPVKDLVFLTDLAGVSHLKLPSNLISEGDELEWKKDFDNKTDRNAIKVYKGSVHVGYIKKIHLNVFHKKNGNRLKIRVKAVERNGVIKRVFVKVFF